ncbi:RING-type E3 ubiquitin-protein ligase PPIL2-like [Anneissia japonica]|uniref:RING-type E3 ubiquitin-protein ligase PPIL2-like n=1 Tax=Anneissia japonica TaxID=1529436 RepID=UPI001425BB41|nr:RING-type E3 ubiquitin-protein ligase PPIL2-like [Anneissia japonica]
MGKRQHQSDKMYITSKEWTNLFGGKKKGSGKSDFKRLPFDHCSLSLQPFEHPYCTKEGVIFDLTSILPYLKRYGLNPITGEQMDTKGLIKLNIHKNSNGKYHCPVTFKVFTDNSSIVAIKTTGNVYAQEAVDQLNIKTKNWKDLLTDEVFTRKDIITLQDPNDLEKFNISAFHHVKNNIKTETEEERKAKGGSKYYLNKTNSETEDILSELYRDYKAPEKKEESVKKADSFNAAHFSTGMVAAGFTSTAMTPQTQHEAAVIDEDIIRYERVKKKGYVRLTTNKGTLNLELHCDMVPKTCENFMKHCQSGYYNNTVFHRSIKNFMIQGGDPTATGKGGESVWGGTFKDEFKPNLTHTGRGMLSMANSGPDTNKSQFFLTYRSCRHLDGKHTVFGRVVGGLDTLTVMEKIKTDSKDRPTEEIKIEKATVFVNPYEEADEQLAKDRQRVKDEEEAKKAGPSKPVTKESDKPVVYRSGVGKYISGSSGWQNSNKREADETTPISTSTSKKKVKSSHDLTDFSGW